MKVIAFPFAGGDKYSYNFLKPYLFENGISMECFDYPGRGNLSQDNFCSTMEDLIDLLSSKLLQTGVLENEDYIFYGHSMGGIVAFLVTNVMEKSTAKKPLRLIVSGCKAPSRRIEKEIHKLESEEFWRELIDMGGTPPEILLENEAVKYYESILRADFKLIFNYEHDTTSILNVPIDVFYGSQEIHNKKEVSLWNLETRKSINLLECKGNHFFIYENAKYIANHFLQVFRMLSTRN